MSDTTINLGIIGLKVLFKWPGRVGFDLNPHSACNEYFIAVIQAVTFFVILEDTGESHNK
jgi:hypothetical protein